MSVRDKKRDQETVRKGGRGGERERETKKEKDGQERGRARE